MAPSNDPDETTLNREAKWILQWYKEWLKENTEPESDVIKTIDLGKPQGRFELLILARLFNNRLKEEKAIDYLKALKQWFLNKGHVYLAKNRQVGMIDIDVVRNPRHSLHDGFKTIITNGFLDLPVWVRNLNYRGFVCCAQEFSETDLIRYTEDVSVGDLSDVIWVRLKKCGIYVKSFLIIREMYKAGIWKLSNEDLWMCCVPDSKVRTYLNDMGFVREEHRIERNQREYTLPQLKQYSKIIWKYFNEPFEDRYFDLPIFRYLKEANEISSDEFERLGT